MLLNSVVVSSSEFGVGRGLSFVLFCCRGAILGTFVGWR